MKDLSIREERPGDESTIYALTEAAFKPMPFSDGSEPRIIDALRDSGDLSLSLVAVGGRAIHGHIAFSPVTIDGADLGWFGLGPVSVWPELHGQGIGSAIIRRGIAELRERGAHGIVLLGSPEYYGRFGFEHDPDLQYPGPPPEYFQRLNLKGKPPSGIVHYPPAFGS